eukprot:Seg831.3_Seg831.7 transcript_id=Seg831.3_Seg831.7/GoldUCD/mRNA.D3Y31 product="Methyl-CpG-binding domain protein 6" protein_id=Seg831.3_Seg831.7/GoldUCD/D3Y31
MTTSPLYRPITVPNGWNRILERGTVLYISPNKSRLRSIADVKSYFLTHDTCKCGLECPLRPEEVFSFNPNMKSVTMLQQQQHNTQSCKACKVDEAFGKVLPQLSPEKFMKLLRKGSKKKKKKSKTPEKQGMKKSRQFRQEEAMEIAKKQNAVPWKKPRVEYSCAQNPAMLESQGNIPLADAKYNYSTNHSDYLSSLKSFEGLQNVCSDSTQHPMAIVHGQITGSKIAGVMGTPNSSFASASFSVTRPTAAHSSKAELGKGSSKKGLAKPRRIPKSKEDLTIASMMGKVKQQVGDIGNVRSSKMFSPASQAFSKQETTVGDPERINKIELTAELNEAKTSLDLIRTRAPPNITLPPSHSNMLPQALAKGCKSSPKSTLKTVPSQIQDMFTQDSTSIQNVDPPSTETQDLKRVQDRLYNEAKANVYWGSNEPPSQRENSSKYSEVTSSPSVLNHKMEATKNRAFPVPSNEDVKVAQIGKLTPNVVGDKTFRPTTANTATCLDFEHPSLSINDSSNKGSTRNVLRLAVSEMVVPVSSSISVLPTSHISQIYSLTNESPSQISALSGHTFLFAENSAKPLAVKDVLCQSASVVSTKSVNIGHTSNNEHLKKTNIAQQSSSVANSMTANEAKVSTKSPTRVGIPTDTMLPSSVSANPEISQQGSPMVVFQFVSQGSSTKSPTRITRTTATCSSATGLSSTPQLPNVAGYPNVYGISNPSNMIRTPSAPYQNHIPANNSAQFVIMGSQASQALQHLALQQNSALQASLQHAENAHAMYLQTLTSYAPSTLKASHSNIGFAYANVPIQFMAIGGAQVIGKQPPPHAATVDRYHQLYQYYQGARPVEAAKPDSNKQIPGQATTLMYPGMAPFGPAAPNNYVRIAPASVANRIALPPTSSTRLSFTSENGKTGPQQHPELTTTATTVHSGLKTSVGISSRTASSILATQEKAKSEITAEPISKHQLTEKAEISIAVSALFSPTITTSQNELIRHQSIAVPIEADRYFKTNNDTSLIPKQESIHIETIAKGKTSDNENISTAESGNGNDVELVKNSDRLNSLSVMSSLCVEEKEEKAENGLIQMTNSSIVSLNHTELDGDDIFQGGMPKGSGTGSPDSADQEEMNLRCNEDCNAASEDSRAPTPEMNDKSSRSSKPDISSFRIGDLIWGHQKGYSAWPGKIVQESDINEPHAGEGKVWIRWFGEHTHSQMETGSLKRLDEGLNEYRNNSKRRKNRSSKKTSESLEKAITEALQVADGPLMVRCFCCPVLIL